MKGAQRKSKGEASLIAVVLKSLITSEKGEWEELLLFVSWFIINVAAYLDATGFYEGTKTVKGTIHSRISLAAELWVK